MECIEASLFAVNAFWSSELRNPMFRNNCDDEGYGCVGTDEQRCGRVRAESLMSGTLGKKTRFQRVEIQSWLFSALTGLSASTNHGAQTPPGTHLMSDIDCTGFSVRPYTVMAAIPLRFSQSRDGERGRRCIRSMGVKT